METDLLRAAFKRIRLTFEDRTCPDCAAPFRCRDTEPASAACPTCTAKRRQAAALAAWKQKVDEWIEAHVPPTYRTARIADCPQTELVEAVGGLWPGVDAAKCVLVYSGAGRGKTHLGWAAAVEWARTQFELPQVWPASSLLNSLSAEKWESLAAYERRMRVLERDCGLLVLDDLGTEVLTDTTSEHLYRIVDARWSWRRPMLVLSNLPIREISLRYDRIASRLAKVRIAMEGPDRRVTEGGAR